MRLNIGCGSKKFTGWSGIDANDHGQEFIGDIRDLSRFDDGSVDEAMAIHVIEHIYRYETEDVLKEWLRILKPGGTLAIECPDLMKVLQLFRVPEAPANFTIMGLFGDPGFKDPGQVHKWCFSRAELQRLMERVGFVNVQQEVAKYHFAIRDLRITGRKPE